MSDVEFAALLEGSRAALLAQAGALGARGEDAQDIVQDALCRAWAKRAECRSPRPWLSGILHNTACLHFRRAYRWREVSDADPDAARRPVETRESYLPGAALAEREAEARMEGLLLSLPRAGRRVAALRILEGLSHTEIAAATGLPEGTVKSRLGRAYGRLRPLVRGAG